MTGRAAGIYRLERQIRVGEHFESYLATEQHLERPVFLKLERTDVAAEPELMEAHKVLWRRLAPLRIAGLPVLFSIGVDAERLYLASEFIDGRDLRSAALPTEPRLRGELGLNLLVDSLRTLAALHRHGIFHGDLSPGNIVWSTGDREQRFWLVDPAPAWLIHRKSDRGTAYIIANPEFAAPEVLDGRPFSVQADLYALAKTIVAFLSSSESPRDRQAPWMSILDSMLDADPEKRPTSAAALLEQVLPYIDASRRPGGLPERFSDSANTFQAPHPATQMVAVAQPAPEPSERARDASDATILIQVPPTDQPNPMTQIIPVARNAERPEQRTESSDATRLVPVPQQERAPREAASRLVAVPLRTADGEPTFVDFTVFAPVAIAPEQRFVLEIWAGRDTDRDEIFSMASRSGQMIESGRRPRVPLKHDTLLTYILRIPDFGVDGAVETMVWRGGISNVCFIVQAPANLKSGLYPGSVKILEEQQPFASMWFEIKVEALGGQLETQRTPLNSKVDRILRGFASYASSDRAEVLRRVQGMRAVGTNIFVDIIDLRSGDDWEAVLCREIASSDGFYLFWSRAAKESIWVDREWRYALGKRGIDFISPVPLVDPRIVEPPKELQSKHFNEIILAFIKAEEANQPGPDP